MVITSFEQLVEHLTLSVLDDAKLHVYFTLPEGITVDARLIIGYLVNPQFKEGRFLSGTITSPQLIVFVQSHRKAEAFSDS